MKHENVNYVKVAPYRSGITHKDFVDKFIKSNLNKKLKINKDHLIRECNRSGYRPRNFREVSNNDIIKPLREFMKLNRKKTRRRRKKGKKTRKGGKKTLKKVVNKYRAPMVLRGTRTQTWINLLPIRDRISLMGYIQGQRQIMNSNGIPEDEQDQITAEWLNEQSEAQIGAIQQAIRQRNEMAAIQDLARRITERLAQIARDEQRRQEEIEIERRGERIMTASPRNINEEKEDHSEEEKED